METPSKCPSLAPDRTFVLLGDSLGPSDAKAKLNVRQGRTNADLEVHSQVGLRTQCIVFFKAVSQIYLVFTQKESYKGEP